MEEDIKNLTEIIELCEEELDSNDENISATLDLIDLKSLRNVLKGYRELEEKSTATLMYIDNKCVRKSKIKEKIEELKGYRDLAKEQIEEKVIIAHSDSLNYGRAEAHNKDIEVLQELMEDK